VISARSCQAEPIRIRPRLEVPSARYALEFAPKALRSLRKLDLSVVERIRAATEALRDEPRPVGAKMLIGMHGVLRIRVGDYRVLYTVDDDQLVILIVEAGHRRQIYR
jgi:mRNA interferase RelE/StbE